jgi:uncharacterized protein (DUF169 family)
MTSPSDLTPERIRELGGKMITILDLAGSPVGVRLLFDESKSPTGAQALKHHRYCQAVMKARRGEHVTLDKEGPLLPCSSGGIWLQAYAGAAKIRQGPGRFRYRRRS